MVVLAYRCEQNIYQTLLELNVFLKEENVRFSLQRNKCKIFVDLQNESKSLLKNHLFYRLTEDGSKLDF